MQAYMQFTPYGEIYWALIDPHIYTIFDIVTRAQ